MGRLKKSPEQFEREVFVLTGGDYKILTPYRLNNEKVKMQHQVCGFEWRVTPNAFLSGTRCPHCAALLHQQACQGRRFPEHFYL